MRLNQQYIPIGDLKAETWLNTHFPEDIPLRISTKGTFYSNYCEDLLEMDTSNVVANRISLSRDGLFHLLPESLFVNDNRLLDPKQKNKPFAPEKEQIMNFLISLLEIPFRRKRYTMKQRTSILVCIQE